MSLLLEYRCECGNLLLKGLLLGSHVEIKCRRCSQIISIVDQTFSNDMNRYAISYDDKGHVVDSSKSSVAVLGYPSINLSQKTIFELAPHITTAGYEKMWNVLKNSKSGIITIDAQQVTADNKTLSLRVMLKMHHNKNSSHVLALYELMPREHETSDKPPFINKNIQTISTLAEVDVEGTYTYMSRELSTCMGYARAEVLGKKYFSFCEVKEQALIQYEFSLMAKSQRAFYVEKYRFLKKDGSALITDACIIPVFYSNNDFRGFKILYKTHNS